MHRTTNMCSGFAGSQTCLVQAASRGEAQHGCSGRGYAAQSSQAFLRDGLPPVQTKIVQLASVEMCSNSLPTFVRECVHIVVSMHICMLDREFDMRWTGEMSRRSVCNTGLASRLQDITSYIVKLLHAQHAEPLALYRITPTLYL